MTYSATHTGIDYTNGSSHSNERLQIFYPSAGQTGSSQYGWSGGYPVFIYFRNVGFYTVPGQSTSPLNSASNYVPVLDRGIAVVEVAVRPTENDGLGTGEGVFQPPNLYASGSTNLNEWDNAAWRNSCKSAVHAVQWVKENAATYNFNANKLVAGGNSGGSFTALFVGMGVDWASHAGNGGQFRSGITSNVNAVVAIQPLFSWIPYTNVTTGTDQVSAGMVPLDPASFGGDGQARDQTLTTSDPGYHSQGDVTATARRWCSPAEWIFNETQYPGCRTISGATPIYIHSTDDLGSTNFGGIDLANDDLIPDLSDTLTSSQLHDGWHAAMLWRTLLNVNQSFHGSRSRVAFLDANDPGTALVPGVRTFSDAAAIYSDTADWMLDALDLSDSNEWSALEALRARLLQIQKSNGFRTDVALVELVDRFPDVIREYPAIMFAPVESDRRDRELLRRINQYIRIDLGLIMETWEDGTRKLSNFIADVEKALTTDANGILDTTLGGTVKDLHVQSDSRFQIDSEEGPRAAAVVRVELVARHQTGNPFLGA